MKIKLFALLILAAIFTSCKKEDSSVSSGITISAVNSTVVTGDWRITYYYDRDHDSTSSFAGYSFNFTANGVVTAIKTGTAVTGTWSSGNDDSHVKLVLAFSSPNSFDEISEDWRVIERTETKIKLQHISGGDGHIDYLTFERN